MRIFESGEHVLHFAALLKVSSNKIIFTTTNMQRREKYLVQRNSYKNGCLIPLCERTTRNKFYSSNDARIGKKDLVVMVQKMNVELTLWLMKNKPKRNAPSDSKKLPVLNIKQRKSHQKKTKRNAPSNSQKLPVLNIKQRNSCQKETNKEIGSSCLIQEKQPFLNSMASNVLHSELDSSCEFLGFVPVVDFPSPLITQSRVLQTNSTSDVIDLEPTPPSSTTSESTVYDSSYSDDNFSGYFSCLESQNKEKVVDESLAYQENTLCKTIQVAILPLEPSLRQLRELYKRKKTAKTRKVTNQNSFRERCLRPSHSLRQFTPFMCDTPETSKSKEKKGKKGQKQNTAKKVKKHVSCQTRLFLNIRDDQLNLELQQKKQAMESRNTFANALDSINKRIIRQSQFWKMLPG